MTVKARKITAAVPVLGGLAVDHRALAVEAIERECHKIDLSADEIMHVSEACDPNGYTFHTYEATAV